MIASRFMTRPSHRDSDLPARMLDAMFEFALDNDVRLLVADCRPHLINNYLRLGFRTYAKTYNDPTVGMLAPLIFVIDDVAHLERIKSRLAPLFRAKRPGGRRRDRSRRSLALLPQATPVRLLSNPAGSPDWMGLQDTLVEDEVSIFHGMEPEEVARLIEMSPVISCASGDRIVGQDLAERSVFVVLDGAVEVMRDGKSVALMTRGAVFGEIAFLLGIDRTADVVAVGDTKVIALRERALERTDCLGIEAGGALPAQSRAHRLPEAGGAGSRRALTRRDRSLRSGLAARAVDRPRAGAGEDEIQEHEADTGSPIAPVDQPGRSCSGA